MLGMLGIILFVFREKIFNGFFKEIIYANILFSCEDFNSFD